MAEEKQNPEEKKEPFDMKKAIVESFLKSIVDTADEVFSALDLKDSIEGVFTAETKEEIVGYAVVIKKLTKEEVEAEVVKRKSEESES